MYLKATRGLEKPYLVMKEESNLNCVNKVLLICHQSVLYYDFNASKSKTVTLRDYNLDFHALK